MPAPVVCDLLARLVMVGIKFQHPFEFFKGSIIVGRVAQSDRVEVAIGNRVWDKQQPLLEDAGSGSCGARIDRRPTWRVLRTSFHFYQALFEKSTRPL